MYSYIIGLHHRVKSFSINIIIYKWSASFNGLCMAALIEQLSGSTVNIIMDIMVVSVCESRH